MGFLSLRGLGSALGFSASLDSLLQSERYCGSFIAVQTCEEVESLEIVVCGGGI